ncbi:hypothetical protein QY702_12105, partial [Xanthomonas campestris pv. plantaginis]|uniref:hypothetical protein n=1 Tax=Xanthomonas campestris TaxID=339 RepID=UPI002B23340A
TSVAWITPQHQAGSVAYLWCVVQRFLIGGTRNGASRNPRAQRYVQTVALLHDAHDNGAIAAIDCAVVALLNSACCQEKARSNQRDRGGAGA